MRHQHAITILLVSVFFITACRPKAKAQPAAPKQNKDSSLSIKQEASGDSYDLEDPTHTWKMPSELVEISGNAWIAPDELLVIEDLHPVLYLLKLQDSMGVIEKKIPFAKDAGQKFDIEDVTVEGNTAYALWSHGSIYKINNWNSKPVIKLIPTFLNKKNNTEGICYSPNLKTLLVACKEDAAMEDEKKSTRAIYQFDINADSLRKEPFMVIQKNDLKQNDGRKIKFYPSAIAVHPLTGDIYILSTKETKCMAVFSGDGKLKSFRYIQKTEMAQPEGICFSPDGILYISTEGKNGNPAYIFAFGK
ncbi:hypothetical protein BH11BAC4_BH11BAC4_26760 [soil metagenome]